MRGRPVLTLIAVAALVIVGGGAVWLLRLDTTPERNVSITTDPTTEELDSALKYGRLEFPPEADVLALQHSTDRVIEYRFVVSVPPGVEEQLLKQSNFTKPFRPSKGARTIEGFEIPDDRPTEKAAENETTDEAPVVYREITIDRTDSQHTILHIMVWSP